MIRNRRLSSFIIVTLILSMVLANPAFAKTSQPEENLMTSDLGEGLLLDYKVNRSFNGTSDFVDHTVDINKAAGLTQGSIAVKFKSTSSALAKTFISASNTAKPSSNISLTMNNGAVYFENRENNVYAARITATGTYNDGKWHTAVLNVGNSGTKIYVDGSEKGSSSSTAFFANVPSLNGMWVGKNVDSTGGEWFYAGDMEYVKVYNRTLTLEEIAELSGTTPVRLDYTIPMIDLAGETDRQVLTDREPGQYLGHPDSVLLDDGKTIYTFYPKGHGIGPIVVKKSSDGGRSWSDRLSTPASWATSQETPTVYKLEMPDGSTRLEMISGMVRNGDVGFQTAYSDDNGATWTELKHYFKDDGKAGIVAMASLTRLKNPDGSWAYRWMGIFHDFAYNNWKTYLTFDEDGNEQWSTPERLLAEHNDIEKYAGLCEIEVIRSPKGDQLALLARAQHKKTNAMIAFSNDEGKTWTEPREMQGSLMGERHKAEYDPVSGRLLITFREINRRSATDLNDWVAGDWVAWVGTYDDLVNNKEGQYRVRLMDDFTPSVRAGDTGYAGNVVLDDGTFVLTSYGYFDPQDTRAPYIMTVRLKLSELDEAVQQPPVETTTRIINDFDTGDGLDQFKFYGPWSTSTGIANLHNGDEHWSSSGSWAGKPENVYYTVKFEGEQLKLVGIKAPNHGIYAVSVDGGAEVEVDAYASSRQFKQVLYDTGKLKSGQHTIKVRATGKKTGTAPDMQIDYAEVTFKVVPVTGIVMNNAPTSITEGDIVQMNASVEPGNATNKKVLWSTSDVTLAQVDAKGKLKALNSGKVSVTATSEDGGFKAVREIEITPGSNALKGAVGTTNTHYVVENLFDDYKRVDYNEIVQMTEKTWKGDAWKGDRASSQFVLWSTNKEQEQVTLSTGDLTNGNNHKIDSSNIKAHFVKTTKAARGNPSQGRPQEDIPDILGSSDPVDIEPFNVQPIWVSIDVPRDAAPGIYQGQLTATSASGESVTFNLELEVLDLTLPEVKDWDFALDLWQNPYAVARVNNIPENQLWTKAHFDAMKPHYEMLAAAGQKVITTTVTYDPWNSQTYDRYDSMVKWTKKADGSFEFNFDIFDQWVQFMMDLGIDKQIDAYSMVSWASKIKYYDEATQRDIIETVPVGDPKWTVMWRAFLEAFVPHLEEKGWLDITTMANDERSVNDMIKAADLIDEVSDGRLKISAAMNYNSLKDPRLDRIHNISVGLIYIQHNNKDLAEIAEHRRSLGLVTTIYNCVGHFPNSFTRSNPAEPVWVMWYSLRHKTDGYLRWAFDSFVQNPYETTDFRTWESGDSAQVYPGAVSSIRFEKMKEGIRDVEKVRYISNIDATVGETLEAEIWKMEAVGLAYDPFNGVKDPGKVDIPQEVTRLKSVLYDASKQVEGEVVQPEEITADLKGPSTVQAGDTFAVDMGLKGIETPVQALDVTVNYNPDHFVFDEATSTLEKLKIIESSMKEEGKVRLIMAAVGSDHQIDTDGTLAKLNFRAKILNESATSSIKTTAFTISNDKGVESAVASASIAIEIVTATTGKDEDINKDGKVSIGDLAIAAAHYGKDSNSPDWANIKHIDISNDKKIDIMDLAAIAAKILQ